MKNIIIVSFAFIFLGLAHVAGAITDLRTDTILQNNESDLDFLKQRSLPGTSAAPPPVPPSPPQEPTMNMIGGMMPAQTGDPDFDLLKIDLGGDDLEKFRAEVSTVDPVKKVTVLGWDPEKKEEIIGRPEDVKTPEDLQTYVEATALNDDAIKGIKIKENVIEVESRERGKLFWFIPVEMSSNVVVQYNLQDSTAERVKVRFPWWHVFVKKAFSPDMMRTELSAELDATIWEKVDNSDLRVQMSRISQTLQVISNIMKTKHDTVKNSISNIR